MGEGEILMDLFTYLFCYMVWWHFFEDYEQEEEND
jgi:hypothetical protein